MYYKAIKLTKKTRANLISGANKTKKEFPYFKYFICGNYLTICDKWDFSLRHYGLNCQKSFLMDSLALSIVNVFKEALTEV